MSSCSIVNICIIVLALSDNATLDDDPELRRLNKRRLNKRSRELIKLLVQINLRQTNTMRERVNTKMCGVVLDNKMKG